MKRKSFSTMCPTSISPRICERERPHVGIYIGAIRQFHNRWVPDTRTLCRANRAAPLIHICSDAGDPPWWPVLEEYHKEKAFRLQIGIDGSRDIPLASFGKIELTPVDPDYFVDADWGSRIYDCGFAGGIGHRAPLLNRLQAEGLLAHLNNGATVRYEYLCAFYTLCRMVVNDDRTGSAARRHVKGRVIEAALAGAALLEPKRSPTRQWFDIGIDYLPWIDANDVARQIKDCHRNAERISAAARRLRAKVIERHAAKPFWMRALAAIGL